MNQVVTIDDIDVSSNGTSVAEPARRRKLPRAWIAGASAVAVAVAGAVYIAAPASRESTDDAYVEADATTVAPRVHGLVAAVLVDDNQAVKAGQGLVRIDAEEFDAHVASARADLMDAEAARAGARAALVSLDAEQSLAAARITAAETIIRSAEAEAGRADADRRRYQALVASGAVPQHDADRVSAEAIDAEQEVARSRAELTVARQAAGVTAARRAILEARVQKSGATVARAQAALDLAELDRRHTLINAPVDGVVGNRTVQAGDYVQPGTRLLTLVPLHALYVTANFKETQIDRMRQGQSATIEVDAFPGTQLTGRVESFAPGSGAQFSLLPFEPGTGNFTKIVQRVAVRIRFDRDQPLLDSLRPGLSVSTRVALD